MKFNYAHLFKLYDGDDKRVKYFITNSGYGKHYSNYKLAEHYITQYGDQEFHINQCDWNGLDKSINNCFVQFESDYLPTKFVNVIERQTGYVLVPSEWMKNVVLSQTNCDQQRIIKLPYVENFDLLKRYKKKLKKTTSNDILRFYTIGDNKTVKNLKNLVQAFTLAFQNQSDVALTIKTSNNPEIKSKESCPKIEIINTIIPQVQLYKLHINNDVYVSPALCVGWQIPPFQAAYFGKPLMCGKHSAFEQWVDYDKAITLQSHKKEMDLKQYQSYFTNNHGRKWMVNDITVDEIIDKLQYIYYNYRSIIEQGNMDLSRFDYRNANELIVPK